MSVEKIFGLWVSGIQAGTRDGTCWEKGGFPPADPHPVKLTPQKFDFYHGFL